MDRTERFYRIDQLLQEKVLVRRDDFLEALEVSPATFKRDLEYMRDRFNAPVIWDADAGGYRYEKGSKAGPRFELPGLWFSESEVCNFACRGFFINDCRFIEQSRGMRLPGRVPATGEGSPVWATARAEPQRYRKPLGCVGQIERLFQIKLRVITEPRRFVSDWVSFAEDCELAPMRCGCTPAFTVGHPDFEVWRVIIEDVQNEGRSRFRRGLMLSGK